MDILAIGNSFSEDSTRYLHQIAKADEKDVRVANLYIGGCSLERHYRNMLSNESAYELQYNGENTGFPVSLKSALLNRAWDVITLQQVSLKSFDGDSYHPYLGRLAEYVRKCVPKAKLYIHQTWAYEAGSDRLLNEAGYETPELMLSDIVNAYDAAKESVNADGIIRSGELFAELLQNGISKIHRDTFHASYGLGRFALGLLWYHTVCNGDITKNSFRDLDEFVSDEEIQTVINCINGK